MILRTSTPIVALMLVGCASVEGDARSRFFSALDTDGEIHVTGWALAAGSDSREMQVFVDHRAMRENRANPPTLRAEAGWPQSTGCISAFFADRKRRGVGAYDGKRVVVTGRLKAYESLPERGGDIMPTTKVWGDRAVENNCFGKKVLILSSVKLAG